MTTPVVQYSYADGSANTIRPTSVTYPNGRVVDYIYNSGDDDALSRVSGLGDDSFSPLVAYTYLGLGSSVRADYQQPGVRWDLATGSGSNPYAGLDPFGRIIDNLWTKYTGTPGAVDQIQYSYDQAGNRTSRQNPVATAAGAMFDELYTYDGMQRLKTFNRGTLDEADDRLTALTFKQGWQLDATGNWTGFQQLDQSDPTQALDQQRTSDTFNEITDISATVGPVWVTPEYDRNGNMVVMPQPGAPTSSYAATYDAWNRLVELTDGDATVSAMAYDGQNWRVSKTVSGTPRHYYYSNGWQVLEERLGSTPDSAAAERQFVWGLRYIDDLVLRDRAPSGSGPLSERLYGLQDANWNMDAICDPSGAVQERYSYSAYGMPTVLNPDFTVRSAESSYDWETLYSGYRYAVESGLYDVRRRTLHCQFGRWLTLDPFGYTEGSNLVAYGTSCPVNATDPTGLQNITRRLISRSPGRNGNFSVNWRFELVDPAQKLLVLIQRIEFSLSINTAQGGTTLPAPSKSAYYEIIGFIPAGQTEVSAPGFVQAINSITWKGGAPTIAPVEGFRRTGLDDTWSLQNTSPDTCGRLSATGSVRAYVVTARLKDLIQTWRPLNQIARKAGTTLAPITSGSLLGKYLSSKMSLGPGQTTSLAYVYVDQPPWTIPPIEEESGSATLTATWCSNLNMGNVTLVTQP